MLMALPPIQACVPCTQPHPPGQHPPGQHPPGQHPPGQHPKHPKNPSHPKPPSTKQPPHHGGSGHGPPKVSPPSKNPPVPPVTSPPILTPPIINPPVVIPPPPSGGGGGGGGGSGGGGGGGGGGCGGGCPVPNPSPPTQPTCPINALKLGLCVDVLGGLVHIGLGNPVENACCPILGGLLELEAAICLCTAIRLKVLNLNIFIPLALQALITCGKNPPPGFVCPPIV